MGAHTLGQGGSRDPPGKAEDMSQDSVQDV